MIKNLPKSNVTLLIFITAIIYTGLALTAWASDNPKPFFGWKAGVARQIITPSENMWMGGFASRTTPSIGKLHDLWAKALALEDQNGQRAVLVSFDLSGNVDLSGK